MPTPAAVGVTKSPRLTPLHPHTLIHILSLLGVIGGVLKGEIGTAEMDMFARSSEDLLNLSLVCRRYSTVHRTAASRSRNARVSPLGPAGPARTDAGGTHNPGRNGGDGPGSQLREQAQRGRDP